MSNFKINATKRSDEGKGASRRLRHQGLVPAIVYGGKGKPQGITLEHSSLWNLLSLNEEIFTSVLSLDVEGKEEQVIIKDLQRHPYANKLVHVDFQRVSKTKYIIKKIPLVMANKEQSPGVKVGALLTPLMSAVEVRCLPENLPQAITVDCSTLEAGESMKLSNVKLPKGVELMALRKGGSEYDHAVLVLGKARK